MKIEFHRSPYKDESRVHYDRDFAEDMRQSRQDSARRIRVVSKLKTLFDQLRADMTYAIAIIDGRANLTRSVFEPVGDLFEVRVGCNEVIARGDRVGNMLGHVPYRYSDVWLLRSKLANRSHLNT